MKTVFYGKRISGLLSVIPQTAVRFEDEVDNYTFPAKQTLRLQKVMGYKQHRIVKEDTATSDLCCAGLEYILGRGWLKREEIGGIVVATSLPDHFIPPVSSVIHGEFQLGKDVACIDVSQGCVAFFWGLLEAFMLLEHMEGKKVVVFAADVLSKKVSQKDRNSYPLIGDGAGIAIVENCIDAEKIHTILYNNGGLRDALKIPAGGSRMPSTQETAILRDMDGDGNLRALDNLTMNGADVFSFVQAEVPPLIDEVLDFAGYSKEDMDWYLFHQPNKFMLRKLAEKLGVPYEKMPMNTVEEFGNSSGACIPINITYNLADAMRTRKSRCCVSAFGAGLTWGAMVMELGEMDFCEAYYSSL